MEYGINKGIGKSVEFRGLKAQYLFIFAGGLLAVFVVFVILYMAGGRSVGMYRFRRCGGFGAGLAYLPPEHPLRGTRADEAARRAPASPLPAQPQVPAPVAEKKGGRV